MRSLVTYFGSIELNRILKYPGILCNACKTLTRLNRAGSSPPQAPRQMPVRTISLKAFAANVPSSSRISFNGLDLDTPLTEGTLQYAQKFSHPSCIFTNALV